MKSDYIPAMIYTDMGDEGELPVGQDAEILAGREVVSIEMQFGPEAVVSRSGRHFIYKGRKYFLSLNLGLTGEERGRDGKVFSHGAIQKFISVDENEIYLMQYVGRGSITFENL